MAKKWSDQLAEETRTALMELSFTPQGALHMKNVSGIYGVIRLEDLMAGEISVKDKKSNVVFQFASADELIAAGWAID